MSWHPKQCLTHSSCPVHACGVNIPQKTHVSRATGGGSADLGSRPSSPRTHTTILNHRFTSLGFPSAPCKAEAAPAPFSQMRRKLTLAWGHKSTWNKILSCFACSSFHTYLCTCTFFSVFQAFPFFIPPPPPKLCITNLAFLPAPTHLLARTLSSNPIWCKTV